MEIEIVYELAQKILTYETILIEASDICGELDRFVEHPFQCTQTDRCSLLALVQGASMYKLAPPQITDENTIDIKGGRSVYGIP